MDKNYQRKEDVGKRGERVWIEWEQGAWMKARGQEGQCDARARKTEADRAPNSRKLRIVHALNG
jgi:hypothetical protein